MTRYSLLFLILGIYSCAPITNRFYSTSNHKTVPKLEYDKFKFDPSDVYALRIKRTVKLEYTDPKTHEIEYSDTPYPFFENVTEKDDYTHVNEENYIILLGHNAGATSGNLLFLSTYNIKGYELQNACYGSTDYFSTYPIQSIEAGGWKLRDQNIDFYVKRQRDSIPFIGTLSKEKLVITHTNHPKQNPSSLYLNEQPMIEVNKIMNVGCEKGLTYLSQSGRQLLYPDWNELGNVANGDELKTVLEQHDGNLNINEIWLSHESNQKKQLFLIDSIKKDTIGYNKQIKF